MSSLDKATGGISASTDVAVNFSNFLESTLTWLRELPLVVKLLCVLIVIFVIYAYWEINRMIKWEKLKARKEWARRSM